MLQFTMRIKRANLVYRSSCYSSTRKMRLECSYITGVTLPLTQFRDTQEKSSPPGKREKIETTNRYTAELGDPNL